MIATQYPPRLWGASPLLPPMLPPLALRLVCVMRCIVHGVCAAPQPTAPNTLHSPQTTVHRGVGACSMRVALPVFLRPDRIVQYTAMRLRCKLSTYHPTEHLCGSCTCSTVGVALCSCTYLEIRDSRPLTVTLSRGMSRVQSYTYRTDCSTRLHDSASPSGTYSYRSQRTTGVGRKVPRVAVLKR